MHQKRFDLDSGTICHVQFNPDFSDMAVISWGSNHAVIPAIVLTVGISEIEDRLFKLWEAAHLIRHGTVDEAE